MIAINHVPRRYKVNGNILTGIDAMKALTKEPKLMKLFKSKGAIKKQLHKNGNRQSYEATKWKWVGKKNRLRENIDTYVDNIKYLQDLKATKSQEAERISKSKAKNKDSRLAKITAEIHDIDEKLKINQEGLGNERVQLAMEKARQYRLKAKNPTWYKTLKYTYTDPEAINKKLERKFNKGEAPLKYTYMWNAVRKIYGRVDDNLLDTLSSGELSDRLIKNENEHKSTGNEEKDLEDISEKANKIRKEIKDRYRLKIRAWKIYSKQFLLNNLWRVQPKGLKKGIDDLSDTLQEIFSYYFSLPNPKNDDKIESYNTKIKDKAATRANEFRDEMKKVYRSVRTTDAEIGFINHFYNKMLTPEQRKIFDSMPEKYRQEAIEKGTTKKEVKEYFDKYATLSKDTIEKERKKEAKGGESEYGGG